MAWSIWDLNKASPLKDISINMPKVQHYQNKDRGHKHGYNQVSQILPVITTYHPLSSMDWPKYHLQTHLPKQIISFLLTLMAAINIRKTDTSFVLKCDTWAIIGDTRVCSIVHGCVICNTAIFSWWYLGLSSVYGWVIFCDTLILGDIWWYTVVCPLTMLRLIFGNIWWYLGLSMDDTWWYLAMFVDNWASPWVILQYLGMYIHVTMWCGPKIG